MASDRERWAAKRERQEDRQVGFALGLEHIRRHHYDECVPLMAPLDVLDGYDEAWRVCGPNEYGETVFDVADAREAED